MNPQYDQRFLNFLTYCAKDGAVTKEIDDKLERYLEPPSRRHYNFNITLLNSLLYMELRGIKYDKAQAKTRLEEVNQHIYELQYQLDQKSGHGLKTSDRALLRTLVRETMCFKRDSSQVKADYQETYPKCINILSRETEPTTAELGYIATEVGVSLNIKGAGLKKYLYDTLELPVQKDPVTGSVTTDYEALITLRRHCQTKGKVGAVEILQTIIDIAELRTRAQMLTIATDPDGRIRSSYNEVGSETGRVTSLTSPTGSGYNLQTIPDENELKPMGHPLHSGMRDLLVADADCYLAKCDLKGADGWTVGANLAALGDSTMLDDLLFGLKPASVLCYASRHGPSSIIGKTRTQLAEMCKEVKKSDWDYFAYKQCIWGFCYLMGVKKAVTHVFNVSEGTVLVKETDMQLAKDMLFRRYNIQYWHRAMEARLLKQPYPPKLESPSGHIRKFFGRKTDIVGEALAHEPQSVTTYATNQAVFNCWTDPENRERLTGLAQSNRLHAGLFGKAGCRLRIEPLHQVHDEFLCQFRKEDTSWAIGKIRQWFANPIRIAGVEVTIPFEGAYGTNWAMDSKSKVGTI